MGRGIKGSLLCVARSLRAARRGAVGGFGGKIGGSSLGKWPWAWRGCQSRGAEACGRPDPPSVSLLHLSSRVYTGLELALRPAIHALPHRFTGDN